MSEPRRLWMRFRAVEVERQPAYRKAVGEAGTRAGEVGVHFWVFEIDGGDGRFVEFFEGPGDESLAAFDVATRDGLSLAAGSGACAVAWIGAAGIRSTEVRSHG